MKMFKLLIISLSTIVILSACSPTIVPPPRSAEHYFKEGENFFEQRRYEDAVASWKKVRDSYYSPDLNKLAELKIAEAQYLNANYEEASASYAAFLKEHPRDDRLADVLYFQGMSSYKQMRSKDRDQTVTQNALTAFLRLTREYPADQRFEEVGFLIQRCQNRLADHEVYVGRFYLRSGQYQAAANRLKGILEDFPNYYYRDEAFYYLGSAYLKLQQRKEAAETFNILYKQFPESEYVVKAQKILEKSY